MFYISLNDKYLQQALSDLKDDNPTLKTYLDEAVSAESKRKCFQDIAVSSSSLDSRGVLPYQNGILHLGRTISHTKKIRKGLSQKGVIVRKSQIMITQLLRKILIKIKNRISKRKVFVKNARLRGIIPMIAGS